MGYIMSVAMFTTFLLRGDIRFIYASALFYMGASIASIGVKAGEDDKKLQK